MDLCEHAIKQNQRHRHPWESGRAKTIATILKTKLPTSFVDILDMGCGDAYFANVLSNTLNNKNITAIDLNFSDEHLKNLNADYPHIQFGTHLKSDQRFHLIILMDVIEHIEHDKAFLNNLAQNHLHSNGIIVITVPAFQSLFSDHDIFLKHYRRYSRIQLINTVIDCGLTPQRSGYFFFSLLLPRALIMLKEKFLPSKKNYQEGLSNWNQGTVLSVLLSNLFYAGNMLSFYLSKFNIRVPGLTTWTICEKKEDK